MELIDIVNYYKSYIYPNKYEISSYHGLKLEFNIEQEQLCHLLFGTVNEHMERNHKAYKGKLGYDNLQDGTITFENLPKPIEKYAKGRMYHFTDIHKLLDSPSGYVFYNKNVEYPCSPIMKSLNIKKCSDIEADFMLCKNINNIKIIYLFLRTVKTNGSIKLIPISFFATPIDENCLIERQKKFTICEVKKKPQPI